jgi:hypothetical protein
VVEHVKQLSRRHPLQAMNATILVDATGVGAPVADLLRRGGPGCRVIPVMIPGGDLGSSDVVRDRVPKVDLLAGLQVALQRRGLMTERGLRALPALLEELRSIEVRVSESGYGRIPGGGMMMWCRRCRGRGGGRAARRA